MSDTVRDNPAQNRFELDVGGHVAVAYYTKAGGVITFTHTEVPQALSGQGIGSKLARGALELVRKQHLQVVAKCPFIAAYMGKHPEFNDLLNTPTAKRTSSADAEKKHLDELLDEALEESFPASDPPAIDLKH